MIKKILVANRGEIAMRIFRTCRVMNISTVAVYTHVDRGALHVRYAEEAYCISKSPEDTSYLKPELILSIAKKTGAAIHPGYGFLSENADFARRCEEEGVIFIGPSADIISKMGIKTEARKIMREAGLPIVPGTETPTPRTISFPIPCSHIKLLLSFAIFFRNISGSMVPSVRNLVM